MAWYEILGDITDPAFDRYCGHCETCDCMDCEDREEYAEENDA